MCSVAMPIAIAETQEFSDLSTGRFWARWRLGAIVACSPLIQFLLRKANLSS